MPLPTIPSGNVASGLATGYDVANSCRFNDDDSAHLNKSLSSAYKNTWTWSGWVKRANLTSSGLFGNQRTDNNVNSRFKLFFNSDDQIQWEIKDSTGNDDSSFKTNRRFRDISAWYHIVFIYDTTDGTAGDRLKLYVNGTRETSFATEDQAGSSFGTLWSSSAKHYVGVANGNSGLDHYFDGYMAEVCFIDGTVVAHTEFGEFDEDTPTIWKPKDVSGLTFGSDGYYLDFADSGDLGDDESGNGNDFTESNLAATDQSSDSPTNNFATLNPLYHYIGGAVLSEGNLKFTTSGNSSLGRAMSTIRPANGKWYVECKVIDVTRFNIGLMNGNETDNAQGGEDTNSVILGYDGGFYMAGSFAGYLSSLSNNDLVQLALDLDNDLFWFGVNDTWGNSATRTEIQNGTATNSGSTDISSQVPINTGAIGIFLEDNSGTGNNVAEINFGSPSFAISSGNADANGYGNFEYAVPSGYYALCTKNLADYG